MDPVYQLEQTVEGWFKSVPHLSNNARLWLADNVWWIVLIGVVLGVIGLFTLVPATLIALGISSSIVGIYSLTYASMPYYWLLSLLSLAALLIMTILNAFAVSPLKAKSRTGWKLVFLSLVVTTVFSIVSDVLSATLMPNVYGGVPTLISGLLGAALSFLVGAYVLFEIRDRFIAKVKKVPKKTPVRVSK